MKKYVWPDNGRTNRAFPDPDGGPLSQENWRETGRGTGLMRPTFPCLYLSLRQAPDSFSGTAVEEQKPRARLFCFLPEWRNGRRSRLKICRQQCREGSTPSSGTILLAQTDLKRSVLCLKVTDSAGDQQLLTSPKSGTRRHLFSGIC